MFNTAYLHPNDQVFSNEFYTSASYGKSLYLGEKAAHAKARTGKINQISL